MTPKLLLQAFYKRGMYVALPSPADPKDPPGTDWWWDHLAKQADVLASHGFTSVWLPPVTKAQQGHSEAALGYSVFDDYDLGWKDQKGALHTRYGDREQLTRCAAILRANGLDIYIDLQLNHRKGGSGPDEMTFEYLDAFFPRTRSASIRVIPLDRFRPAFSLRYLKTRTFPTAFRNCKSGRKSISVPTSPTLMQSLRDMCFAISTRRSSGRAALSTRKDIGSITFKAFRLTITSSC